MPVEAGQVILISKAPQGQRKKNTTDTGKTIEMLQISIIVVEDK